MEDAEDKFFNGYLRRNMAKIVTKVKVRELVPHLPSLTHSERENIEAKRENTGNYNAMQLLLSCLRQRDNWVEEFVTGLQLCENSGLASQIQEEYESLKIQTNGSAVASTAPTSGGTTQPSVNPSKISTPKMNEAADGATPLPPEATLDDGILVNHTGPSSDVVPSPRPPEAAVSMQASTTVDTGVVPSTILFTPTSHISPPAELPSGPQIPLVQPIQDTNLPDEKQDGACDKPTDGSRSTVDQVLGNDSHSSPVEEVAGVKVSMNVQDATDGLSSPSYVVGASADEEECPNKSVLLTCIHSVQVHQPFDSPSAFPPITEEGAYSDGTVNPECSSNLTSESVNALGDAENIALSDAKKDAPGEAERVDPGNAESLGLSEAEIVAPGDAGSIALCDAETAALDDEEKGALGDAGGVSLNDTKMVVPGDAGSVVVDDVETEAFSDAARVAPGEVENVDLCDPRRADPTDVESEAVCYEERAVPGDIQSGAVCDPEGVAPGDGESEALCDAERATHGHAECEKENILSEKEVVTPHDIEGVLSGNFKSAVGNVESFPPKNKNPTIPRNEDNIVSGETGSIALENQQSVVVDSKEKIIVNANAISVENIETIVCNELVGSSLEDPESGAEKNYISTSNHDPESVIHGSGCNIQNSAADIMETTSPCITESVAFVALETRDPSYTHLSQNMLKGNDCDIAHQEISLLDAPSSNHDTETCFPGEADNGVSGEGGSGTPGERDSSNQVNSESGALCTIGNVAPAEGHSETSSDEDNGDTDNEAPGEEDNGASGNTDGGAPGGGDNGASGDKGGGAPGGGSSGPPGDTDSGPPGNGDSGASGKGDRESPGKTYSSHPGERDAREDDISIPVEEDSGESSDQDSGVPGKGDSMIPDEGRIVENGEGVNEKEGRESMECMRNTGGPKEGELEQSANEDGETPGYTDSGTPNEVGTVVTSCIELPPNNPGGNQDPNHLEVNFPASLSNHISKNIPSNVESAVPNVKQITTPSHLNNVVCSDTESTHKELVENQYNSTHLQISLPSATLSGQGPETVSCNGTGGITPGNTEPLCLETEENHCNNNNLHLKIRLSSAESFIPTTDSPPPDNMGSQSPGGTSSSNKEPTQNHCSSTHLTSNLTSSASLTSKPDSAAYADMESPIHKSTKNHCNTPSCDNADEQNVEKELCISEDVAAQNHTTSGETPVGVVTEERLGDFPEQGQPNSHSPLGNFYVPAALAGVVAAAMLWQLKK